MSPQRSDIPFAPLLIGVLASCGSQAAPTHPAGTVMLLDGAPVLAAEVDAVAAELEELQPTFSLPQRRRQALLSVVLPALHARAGNDEARAAALEQARSFRDEAVAATDDASLPPVVETHWQLLGIDVWLAVHELEPGTWSEPLEVPGAFVVARMVDRDRTPKTAAETLRMRLEFFPWVPVRANLAQDIRSAELEIVDPAWEDVVPASWRHAMRGGNP